MSEKRVLGEGRYLRLLDVDGWEYAERRTCSGIVALVAVTPEGRLLLVEQFRRAVGARVLELPAGIAGDEPGQEDEALAMAAQRELVEETGWDAETFEVLCAGPPTAGATSEVVTLVRARGLKRVGKGGGTAEESITVHEVELERVDEWLREQHRNGLLVDPKVYAGLYFALNA